MDIEPVSESSHTVDDLHFSDDLTAVVGDELIGVFFQSGDLFKNAVVIPQTVDDDFRILISEEAFDIHGSVCGHILKIAGDAHGQIHFIDHDGVQLQGNRGTTAEQGAAQQQADENFGEFTRSDEKPPSVL